MRDEILQIYKTFVFTSVETRTIDWINHVIKLCSLCPVSQDNAANVLVGAALNELRRIKLFMLDKREFPELYDILPRNIASLSDTIVSFIRVESSFIQGGFLYVHREFIFPVAQWHYCLRAQTTELSFLEYLAEHDVEVFEHVQNILNHNSLT